MCRVMWQKKTQFAVLLIRVIPLISDMLKQFFKTIRIAWIAGQISANKRVVSPPSMAFHHPLVQSLYRTLDESNSGVFVHWGVYESGKSMAVREAAWRLQEDAGRQVILLHGFDLWCVKGRKQALRQALGVPDDTHEPLSELFVKPATTLIIDHADLLLRDKDNPGDETLEFVLELMKESETTQKFNVLLVFNSWECANELVDAGCKLVPAEAPGRWSREQLEHLFDTLPDQAKGIVSEKKDELLRLSTLSGTPGFLTYEIARDPGPDPRHAAMHDLEWRRGLKALYQQKQLCLEPHADEGRFPDRNGVYHHEDLCKM